MASEPSADSRYLRDSVQRAVKIAVVGPFGVGKTSLVSVLSEIEPLRTEEVMTQASIAVDDLAGLNNKTTTTVAMDFGRLTLNDQLVLYLFGAPGQARFQRLWHDLVHGALGALVLADTRRLDQSFDVIDWLEEARVPYAIAVNDFPDAPTYDSHQLRAALDLLPGTPLTVCDARNRHSARDALVTLVTHLHTLS
ncbi:GTP-binding protein [Kitasatospora indigofera]|uniref:GTP-binding protein n=1 Tax=Kitasatospora indigofera TaxID=67307 RepID=UPI0036CAC1DB